MFKILKEKLGEIKKAKKEIKEREKERRNREKIPTNPSNPIPVPAPIKPVIDDK
jgi:hypothetical protein